MCAGKTHTMTGDKVGHMRGIIPRSVEQIVEQAVLMRESGWEIIVTASMVSTYSCAYSNTISSSIFEKLSLNFL